MDYFDFIAIMLYAIQRDMIGCSVIDVINSIDNERMELSRVDYLGVVVEDALRDHYLYAVSYCVYNKYLEDKRFYQGLLPF